MNEQLEFAKKINELTELALDQEKVIFEDQLYAIFPEIKGDEAKFKVIKEFLDEKKIGLNEKLSFEELITEDEKDYLNYYLEELKETDKLTKNQREAYLLSAMAGDEAAALVILQDFLNDVVDIAKLYAGQGVLLEDLIGEGNLSVVSAIGLIGSCENAKEAEGLLAGKIMDAMQDLIGESLDTSREEEKLLEKVNKVSKAAKEMADALGRKVTIDELSQESGLTETTIKKALKLTANAIEDIEIPDELK